MYTDHAQRMVIVPPAFGTAAYHPFAYPKDNLLIFEEWYFMYHTSEAARGRLYLPIFWTGYYIRCGYGKDAMAIQSLQEYINTLDRTKKYYTIVQYDDGILNDLTDLDIRVFSMSGKPMHYPLPLICSPHSYQYSGERDIFMSFVGRRTHRVRDQLIDCYKDHPDCLVTDTLHSLEDYCEILSRSIFALCPRGYGPTSFRIAEAIQYGAIPVYISDYLIFPHHFVFPGLAIPLDKNFDPASLLACLQNQPAEIQDYRKDMPEIFQKYYSYEGNKQLILENLYHDDTGKHPVTAN